MTVRIERLRTRRAAIRVDAARFMPPFLLAGYGMFVLSLFARGVMSWYINPTYIAPTTLAGAVLVGLAVVGLGRRPDAACVDGCCETGDCGCAEPSPKLWTYGVLVLPLLLALIFPPRSLAAFSANERGPQLAGLTTVRGAAPLKRVSLSVDTRQFSMEDWVGALSADPNPRDYMGKPIVVSGIAVHNSASVPPGYIMVIRYLVTCCIADARPVGVVVKDISHGSIKDNQWVTVTGKMGAASYQGQQIAVVLPTGIAPTKGGSPYIY
jgi:putative membrane protein